MKRLALASLLLVFAGCGDDSGGDGHMMGGAGQGPVGATTGPLPCAIDAIVVEHCHLCHGPDGPKFGAPFRLVMTEDFHGMSFAEPTRYVWDVANERIHKAGMGQMPPIPADMLVSPQLETFSAWLTTDRTARPAAMPACP